MFTAAVTKEMRAHSQVINITLINKQIKRITYSLNNKKM